MACGGVFLRVLAQVGGDAELQRREKSSRPIRVRSCRGLRRCAFNRAATPVADIRLVAIAN